MENQKQEYIGCLNAILILWLIGGVISLFFSIPMILMSPIPGIAIGVVICEIISLVGLALLLQFKKIGFYLFVGSYVLLLLAVLFVPDLFSAGWLLRILLGLILFLILMAIKNKETRMNGYQTIGITESDEIFDDYEIYEQDGIEVNEDSHSDIESVTTTNVDTRTDNPNGLNDTVEPIIDTNEIDYKSEDEGVVVKQIDKVDEASTDAVIASVIDNPNPEPSQIVTESEPPVVKQNQKKRKGWIITAISLGTVLIISGAICLIKCDRRTPEDVFNDAKSLIESHQYEKGIAELEKIQEVYIPAKALLGNLLTLNDSVKKDVVRGEKLLWEAFEDNDTSAGVSLGRLYNNRGSWEKLHQISEKLAELNNVKGYRTLSWLHWTDKVGGEINKKRDYSKAEYYALMIAEKDPYSCFYLGCMYSEGGYGIKKDYAKAYYWFKHGADLGDADCYGNLGWLYFCGYGVKESDKKAFNSFKKAIEIDSTNVYAYSQLAYMFKEGYYVKTNRDSAKYYYQKAAKYGDEESAIIIENDF